MSKKEKETKPEIKRGRPKLFDEQMLRHTIFVTETMKKRLMEAGPAKLRTIIDKYV